jgi:hypothetical protein
MLTSLRDMFKAGGTRRARYTYIPLVFEALRLARRVREAEEQGATVGVGCKRVLQMVYEIGMLTAPLLPTLALPLFLQAAHVAAAASYEPIAYEFITQVCLSVCLSLSFALSLSEYRRSRCTRTTTAPSPRSSSRPSRSLPARCTPSAA